MCVTQQASRVAMAVGTGGLSEAIRPALSRTWQNNLDHAGSFGISAAAANMNKQPEVPKVADPAPSTANQSKSNSLAIQATQQKNANSGLNTGYLVN
jgi:hypothetical protein